MWGASTQPTADLEDTFCLILMEHEDALPGHRITLIEAAEALKEVGAEATTGQIATLWGKYVGWDGRTLPTHDFTTQRVYR